MGAEEEPKKVEEEEEEEHHIWKQLLALVALPSVSDSPLPSLYPSETNEACLFYSLAKQGPIRNFFHKSIICLRGLLRNGF